MKLNKSSKMVIGIFTFLPFITVVGTFSIGLYQAFSFLVANDPMMPSLFLNYLGYIIPYIFLFFLLYLGLGIFYIVHIVLNKLLDTEKKFLWIIVLIILNGIAMPAYWYIHIWKDQASEHPQSNSSFDQFNESRTEPRKF